MSKVVNLDFNAVQIFNDYQVISMEAHDITATLYG